jgi:arginase
MSINDEPFVQTSCLARIGVPSSAGAHRTGQEGAPAAFRAARLLERLQAQGVDVADLGDLPVASFGPDPEHASARNLALVVNVARETADRVERSVASRRFPVVLGGDCSLSLGVIAGLLRHSQRLGLLYFDGDVDLNTSETTHSGIFDGMVVAHILGRGAPELAGIGPRRPMLSEEDIVLFGYDVESGWVDPPELDALDRSRMSKYPLAEIRSNAAAAASEALLYLENRSDAVLVHFDVDVMDFAAADVPHPHGLDVESAFAALRVFASSPKWAGLVVTEFNTGEDPEGLHAERLVQGLVDVLGGRARNERAG